MVTISIDDLAVAIIYAGLAGGLFAALVHVVFLWAGSFVGRWADGVVKRHGKV